MDFGLIEMMGCVLALVMLVVLFVVESARWIPVRKSDRIGGGLLLGTVVVLGAAVQTVERGGGLTFDDMGALGAVGLLILLWGWTVLRERGPEGGVFVRLLTVLAGGAFAVWLAQPTNCVQGEADPIWDAFRDTSHDRMHLAMIIAATFAMIHIPLAPGGPVGGLFRVPWGALRLAHLALKSLAWVGLLGALIIVFSFFPHLDWHWIDGLPGDLPDHLRQLSMVLVAYFVLGMLYGIGVLLGRNPLVAKDLESVPTKRLRRPFRWRMDLPKREGFIEEWRQLFPTTGAPLVGALMLVVVGFGSTTWQTGVGAAFLLMLAVGVRGYRSKKPFGPTVIDLDAMTTTSHFKMLRWSDDRGLLVRRDLWMATALSSEPETLLEERDTEIIDGAKVSVFRPEEILQISLLPVRPEAIEPDPEDDDGDTEGDPDAKEGQEEDQTLPATQWTLEVRIKDGGVLSCELGLPTRMPARLELLADLWFLAARIGCPVRLPHRRLVKAATRGAMPGQVRNDLEAWATQEPALDEEAGGLRWLTRDNGNGGRIWFAPTGEIFKGGLWWLVIVNILAMAYVASMSDLEDPIRWVIWALFIPMLWLETIGRRAEFKDPDVYCVEVVDGGLQVQDEVHAWDEMVDLNALPAQDFPLAWVSGGKLIGLPCPLPLDQRLVLAAEIGTALRRQQRDLRRAGLSPPHEKR